MANPSNPLDSINKQIKEAQEKLRQLELITNNFSNLEEIDGSIIVDCEIELSQLEILKEIIKKNISPRNGLAKMLKEKECQYLPNFKLSTQFDYFGKSNINTNLKLEDSTINRLIKIQNLVKGENESHKRALVNEYLITAINVIRNGESKVDYMLLSEVSTPKSQKVKIGSRLDFMVKPLKTNILSTSGTPSTGIAIEVKKQLDTSAFDSNNHIIETKKNEFEIKYIWEKVIGEYQIKSGLEYLQELEIKPFGMLTDGTNWIIYHYNDKLYRLPILTIEKQKDVIKLLHIICAILEGSEPNYDEDCIDEH